MRALAFTLVPVTLAGLLLLSCGGDRVVPNRPPPALPEPACGDGTVDEGEDCDGSNLNEQSCSSLGFDLGTLSCDARCQYATAGCVNFCGNGTVEPGEQCDPGRGPGPCDGWGYTGCSESCQWNATTCRTQGYATGPSLALPAGGRTHLSDLAPKGAADLVTAAPGFSRLQTHEWKPAQGFVPGRTLTRGEGKEPLSPIAADLDGDGHVDLAAINTDGTVDRYRYLPAGSGEPAQFVIEPLLPEPSGGQTPCQVGEWLAAGTVVGGAGTKLVALACPGATGSITWDGVYVFPGGPSVAAPLLVSEPGIRHAAAADVDGDGVLDLVLSLMDGDVVLRRGPDFAQATVAWLPALHAQALLTADLDGDGDGDLVAFVAGEAVLFEQTAQGLTERRRLSAVGAVFGLVRDLDLDGRPDLAWLAGDRLEVRRNVGDFTFSSFSVVTGPGIPQSLSVGDLESDGDLDLAATYRPVVGSEATVTYPLVNPVRG